MVYNPALYSAEMYSSSKDLVVSVFCPFEDSFVKRCWIHLSGYKSMHNTYSNMSIIFKSMAVCTCNVIWQETVQLLLT